MTAEALTRRLERVAFRAWPAREVLELQGWRLRFMDGVTHRGNSVYTSDWEQGADLEQRIAAVERFYRERGAAPSFHLSPLAGPDGLEEALAGRGYVVEAPVSVQIAEVASLIDGHGGVRVEREPYDEWFALGGARSRFAAHQLEYRGLIERLAGRALFALASAGGEPAATTLGVLDDEWLGIHSMLTQPEFRRRGLARALLSGLARHAAEQGARQAYLLVELDNEAALRVYERAGFREVYRTHYRTLL